MQDTAFDVIVYQSHGLHESIDRSRADEFPAALPQFLRQGYRGGRRRPTLWSCIVILRFETPDEGRERSPIPQATQEDQGLRGR